MDKIAFILDHKLQHYRIPFFNKLANDMNSEIVVFHKGNKITNHENETPLLFKEVCIIERKIGPFRYRSLSKKLNEFDKVVFMQNLRYIDLWLATFNFCKNYKLIQWGIGVSSRKGLQKQNFFTSYIRNILMAFSDSIIFYSNYPLKYVSKRNLKKCFVANNTVYNKFACDLSENPKDSFLFIGTLNKRKGVDILLRAFALYLKNNSCKSRNINKLLIVGEGSEELELKKLTQSLGIHKNVYFLGKITDFKKKKSIYASSALCISPQQAGLSVLESFSFGVPFLAYEKAISGGEHLDIKNDYNGFLVENENDIYKIMLLLDSNKEFVRKLGRNSFKFYINYRSMDNMVNKFINALSEK